MRFSPSRAAAPDGPPTTPPESRSARTIVSRSMSRSVADLLTTGARSFACTSWSGMNNVAPEVTITARSMTFSSSRMLPGQCQSCSICTVCGEIAGTGRRHALREALGEVARQCRDVVLCAAQRRDANQEDVEAVEQVAAERVVFDHAIEIAAGRGDDADVGVARARAAEALELALLQDAQQLRLDFERQVADFVEKQRAVVGELEPPDLGGGGAGERPFS